MKKYVDIDKLVVKPIEKNIAKDVIIKHHYSKLWTKCSVALGLFYNTGKQHKFFATDDEKLIGVCVYGDPIGRHSGASISELLDRTEVFELTRLCCRLFRIQN